MIPAKWLNMIKYNGIFGPADPWRKQVVPSPDLAGKAEDIENPGKKLNYSFAMLMRRSLGIDPDKCPKCSGEMKIIAAIKDRDSINKILDHIGHSTDPPNVSSLGYQPTILSDYEERPWP